MICWETIFSSERLTRCSGDRYSFKRKYPIYKIFMIRALPKYGRQFKLVCLRRLQPSFFAVCQKLFQQYCKDFGREICVSLAF